VTSGGYQTHQDAPSQPPTQPGLVREAPRSLWDRLWPEVIFGSVLVGAALFGASFWAEDRRASEAQEIEEERGFQSERLENLRFVRDGATRESGRGAMPFRGLHLEDMNLGGLDLSCRDKPEDRAEGCTALADFTDAHLSSADMSDMNLEGANFADADLRNADLSCSIVRNANFEGAEMGGVNLEEVANSEGAPGRD